MLNSPLHKPDFIILSYRDKSCQLALTEKFNVLDEEKQNKTTTKPKQTKNTLDIKDPVESNY